MPRRLARLAIGLGLVGLLGACGGGAAESRAAGPLDADAFEGTAEGVTGGTVDLGDFADQDLVVWFWSPW